MDPNDWRWAELIFPHCEPSALLASRAVCRAFRHQLDAAPTRLWLPLTTELHRMSYAERMLGWPGVARAMARERTTRANCDAGRVVEGPLLTVAGVGYWLYCAGRLVAFLDDAVQLLDGVTGALLTSLDVACDDVHEHAVCDRYILFFAVGGRVLLLDCVTAQLLEVAPAPPDNGGFVNFSVAGPRVSFCIDGSAMVTVAQVAGTAVREVARVTLSHTQDRFHLCDRGRSYLLFDFASAVLHLVEVATGQRKRTFTLPAGLVAFGCQFFGERDFVVVRATVSTDEWLPTGVVFRISDGRRSEPFSQRDVLLCQAGLVCGPASINDDFSFVDTSGTVLSRNIVKSLAVDTSGAMVWHGSVDRCLFGSAQPDSKGRVLAGAGQHYVCTFRYGVCVFRTEQVCHVLRFDSDLAPGGDPEPVRDDNGTATTAESTACALM